MFRRLFERPESRHAANLPTLFPELSVQGYLEQFKFNNNLYQFFERSSSTDAGMGNSIVMGAVAIRGQTLGEAELCWEDLRKPTEDADDYASLVGPGRFFHTPASEGLKRPWPKGTTADLLGQMDFDASFFGNSYWYREDDGTLTWLDPCNMQIIYTPRKDTFGVQYGAQIALYKYCDKSVGGDPVYFKPSEVVHHKPLSGPNPHVGQSWVANAIEDIYADNGISKFKTSFVANAATPNLAVVFKPSEEYEDPDLAEIVEAIDNRHAGAGKAFKTIAVSGGADVRVIGSNLRDLDTKQVQGAGESRIAAASGVPAPILGNSEGLAGSSLNTGNYAAARRRFADGTLRPLWRDMCAAIEDVLPKPRRTARLWYDASRVEFLQEDLRDAVEIFQARSAVVNALVQAGWSKDASVKAAGNLDVWELMGQHTGLQSVQLLPEGESAPVDEGVDDG